MLASLLARIRKQLNGEKGTSSYPLFVPHGHFYSPFPDLDVISTKFKPDETLCGVDLCEADQLAFLDVIHTWYDELPFRDEADGSPGGTRYGYNNLFFGHSDAITLYTVMRAFKPRRIIEVGSGYSSAVMLDVKSSFLPDVDLYFIEPYPDRLHSLLRVNEACEIVTKPVQDIPLAKFKSLGDGDILFIDSSHVSKAGSDVNDLFFRIIPNLASGVLVHVHDILWPFEYPVPWLREGRAWNEAYVLRAFLQFNSAWKVLYFNAWMGLAHADSVRLKAPLMLQETGGSFWMRRR